MSSKLQPVRGTKDLFDQEIKHFNQIIQVAKNLATNYGFSELQTPIFEFSEIFERNLGEASDIISKEVYKFKDRGDNFLTLRPEFTAAIVRALLSNGELQQILPRKFFSFGPIFRYDRPQKGRQRQFHQINYEVFGSDSFLQDVEIIDLAAFILDELNILPQTELQINSLGCDQTKKNYELALKEYFSDFVEILSADSKNRLQKNVLRILDSKDVNDIKICQDAPSIQDFYSDEAKNRFEQILKNLEKINIKYKVNEKLVRGLDYYSSTVFEFVMSDKNSAQNTVLAGGRYDKLVEKMGKKPISAIGFAAGIERLMLLSEYKNEKSQKISVIYIDRKQENQAFLLAQKLRKNNFETEFYFDSSFKKQMKKANQNDSKLVLILGEDEVKNNEINVKNFENSSEEKIKLDNLFEFLQNNIDKS